MENYEKSHENHYDNRIKLEGTPWGAEEIYYPLNMSPVLLIFVPRIIPPPLIK